MKTTKKIKADILPENGVKKYNSLDQFIASKVAIAVQSLKKVDFSKIVSSPHK